MKDYKTGLRRRLTSKLYYWRSKCEKLEKMCEFNESFLNWTCDQMDWYEDLIYKQKEDIKSYRFLLWFIIIFILGFEVFLTINFMIGN